ncbi:right-handed parallel beta-helix repeat-containing protein [Bacillus sp. Xin]|uniref:right-handed parallel beta-helix repeat-containing protein n=1 Tax=unclassified Bacillus (in: firmicutes) TaxID=185979 RepID=UPI001572631A|nr:MULTISPECIES: right-handed parallel beta-helix repeat-containing protein [unclassified Bacillus (in: firmicutes)]MBC6971462.1 right-handed parallel beta-helix repeat-containing protein [Bacillus sp. Xin]NSW35951.1 right-handed parallel beta-helix repeat-containing protein [Bacillus sp. Xin1]
MAILTVVPGTNAIQNAVNTATSGDVILVKDGVYNESVTINNTKNNIRIVAERNRAFLNGDNTLSTAFTLTSGVTGVEINGFNISRYMEDGIEINGSFNLITRNTITNVNGDGIDIESGNGNLILGNTIQNIGDNTASSGIEISADSNWFVNNTVRGNFNRGIAVFSNSNGVIGNQIFNNNGTGIQVNNDFNIIERNTVRGNRNNGLVLSIGANDNFIFRNTISNNRPNNILNNGIDNNFLQNNSSNHNENDCFG